MAISARWSAASLNEMLACSGLKGALILSIISDYESQYFSYLKPGDQATRISLDDQVIFFYGAFFHPGTVMHLLRPHNHELMWLLS